MELYLVASFFAVKSNAPINIIQSPNKYLLSTRVPYNELDSGDLDVNKTAKIDLLTRAVTLSDKILKLQAKFYL